MKETIQQMMIPILLGLFACQGLWELIMYKIKKKDSDKDGLGKVVEELKAITNRLDKIENRLANVEGDLKLNNEATKGLLYTELDKWLNKMEIVGCWSSESKERFDRVYNLYLDLGDGIDGGLGLRNRADSIPVDNTQYHEKMSRFNKHKIEVMKGE